MTSISVSDEPIQKFSKSQCDLSAVFDSRLALVQTKRPKHCQQQSYFAFVFSLLKVYVRSWAQLPQIPIVQPDNVANHILPEEETRSRVACTAGCIAA